jgi:hypothetical protein
LQDTERQCLLAVSRYTIWVQWLMNSLQEICNLFAHGDGTHQLLLLLGVGVAAAGRAALLLLLLLQRCMGLPSPAAVGVHAALQDMATGLSTPLQLLLRLLLLLHLQRCFVCAHL